MTRRLFVYSFFSVLLSAAPSLRAGDVTATVKDDTIEFRSGNELITSYKYGGTVPVEKGIGTKPLAKPFFFPVNIPGGTGITRTWPMVRGKAGDTNDHFHQKSVWFCHGDVIAEGVDSKVRSADKRVRGIDFWAETAGHGRIVCISVSRPTASAGAAQVVTTNEWRNPDDTNILTETRTITVQDLGAGRLIRLDIDLHANVCPITFGDTKEGSMGVRVSDEFRLNGPGSKGVVTSSNGVTIKAPAKDNLSIWGLPADWHDYSGVVGGTEGGVAIFDHPANAQRSAWHTRAYGLMAANPFARKDSGFPGRKGDANLVKIPKGEHLKLTYGIYSHSGDANSGKVAEVFQKFAASR